MEREILEIMEKTFKVKGLDKDCSQKNCEKWDSLHHLNLIVALESKFGVEFEPEEISSMNDFSTIFDIITGKR